MGGGIAIFFEKSPSPFVRGNAGVNSVVMVFESFPCVDTVEIPSPFDILAAPFERAGLLLPFSDTPLMPPFTDKILLFREDLRSQLLALGRPFGSEFRARSCNISPLV
jgi:hypothetical protein